MYRAPLLTVSTCHCKGAVLRDVVLSSPVDRHPSCRDFLDLGY